MTDTQVAVTVLVLLTPAAEQAGMYRPRLAQHSPSGEH
jgi:hypothetical protein